ncbi:hypothetical protein I4F81_006955 [Pyropia yezoensis]|uniref:Uncharacterized protein n=1 Tax=Pyropia yezoensis TaxID=2788 RepID=A0ACC3C2M9_PYRYE|nr:hypothetical protein I4F81_006955 [Neopyropia yezoensis]
MDILQPLPGGGSGDDCEGVASASRASPEVGLGGCRAGSTVRLDQVDGLPPGPSQDRAEDTVVDHGAYNASERCKSRRSQADVMKRSCDTHAFDAVRPASDLLADAASESVIDRQSNVTARRSRKRKYTPLSVGPRTVMDVRRYRSKLEQPRRPCCSCGEVPGTEALSTWPFRVPQPGTCLSAEEKETHRVLAALTTGERSYDKNWLFTDAIDTEENTVLMCATCRVELRHNRIPKFSKRNGFEMFDHYPSAITNLNELEIAL